MTASKVRRRLTPHEFLTHPAAAGPSELVRGEVRMMTPAGGAHGVISVRLLVALNAFVEARKLGLCFSDNTGFLLPGLADTVRSPDAAFVRADRLPLDGIDAGWVPVAPDLIAEILSPSETQEQLEEKLADYFAAGTQLAWVVNPATRNVSVRLPTGDERSLSENDILDGGDVLPGFGIPVASLFVHLAKRS